MSIRLRRAATGKSVLAFVGVIALSALGLQLGAASASAADGPEIDLSGAYNRTSISSNAALACGGGPGFDGSGHFYSDSALADSGVVPGTVLHSGAHQFTWPNVPVCTADSVAFAGQTIAVTPPVGASELAILGAAVEGGKSANITVTYTDSSTASPTLSFADWGGYNGAVVTTHWRNDDAGFEPGSFNVYAATVPLDPAKTVASITLPNNNQMLAFAADFVAAPAFTAASPPTTVSIGTSFSYVFAASGTPTPALTVSGTLPAGLIFHADGTLSGTPTTTGSSTFTVTADNAVTTTTTPPITITVRAAATEPEDDGDGDSSGLAATGTDILPLVGVALAALLAGLALIVTTRRRRHG
jgi:hypothetical protein